MRGAEQAGDRFQHRVSLRHHLVVVEPQHGDPVNIAARIEALTRVHQVDILVTEEVMKTLDPRFVTRAMPPVAVKGKTDPIATFAIESYDSTPKLRSPLPSSGEG